MSSGARLAGALVLAAVFVGIQALVVGYRGASPRVFTAVEAGSVAGLVSLLLELHMIDRSDRSFSATGVQATFMSFVMRLVVVAPLTLLFMRKGSEVDHEAFALSYCSTFFVYLCWLTWKSYHAPVQYKGRGTRPSQATPRSASVPTRAPSRSGGWR